MLRIDLRDLIGGALLFALGVWFLVRSLQLQVGTSTAMGPGYYPMLASGAMIGLSLIIVVSSLVRPGDAPEVSWRPLLSVGASILTFAIVMDFLGLMPAIFATVAIASLADRRSRPVPTLLLAAGLCVGAYVLFIKLLGMPMQPLKWY
ncbi:tripartite tricarboxylate transporter TctB family protein [Phreatobacter sp. HK31-P]|nr:tripartite tricarboxylate transporter TctB family protein [Phreatobacter sp.]